MEQRPKFIPDEFHLEHINELKQTLSYIVSRIQQEHEGLAFENPQQQNNFINSIANMALKLHGGVIKKDSLLNENSMNELRLLLTTKPLANLVMEDRFDEALMEKIGKLLQNELINKKELKPENLEQLKLELKKLLSPKEAVKLDRALDTLMKNDEFKKLFGLNMRSPRPEPKKKNTEEMAKEAAVDGLSANLFGLSCLQAGCLPVVVSCFLGNPLIVRQGPTYETEMTQIALPDRVSDTLFGDSLGLNNQAVKMLAENGPSLATLSDNIVAEIARPTMGRG